MPADTSSFVAGHYTVTYNAQDLGTTELGFDIRPVYYKEDIRIDDFGDTIVDGIYRGYNLRISCQLSEWAAAGREIIQFPFDKFSDGAVLGTIQDVGKTLVFFAKQMVFTPVANINVNSLTYAFPLTVPEGDHGGWTFNTKLRRVTINMLVLPNRATGLLFTET